MIKVTNKKFLFFICVNIYFSISIQAQKYIDQSRAEHIKYNVHYGIINAGELSVLVDSVVYSVDSAACKRVAINGKTTGLVSSFAKINDIFISYIDTSNHLPKKFQRIVEENNYRKWETYIFDRSINETFVSTKDGDKAYVMDNFKITANTHDIVSAYLQLRKIDFSKISSGDTFMIDVFLENKLMQIQFRFVGKQKIKTKIGKLKTIVISPIMPENSIFDGKNSITAYISDDFKKIPLKIKAKLLIGSIEVDIEEYKN